MPQKDSCGLAPVPN